MTGQPLASPPSFFQATSPTLSVPTATTTPVPWATHTADTDGMHNTSAANLTGTVAKTNGNATLTGTSTLFTTEVAVGDALMVPGGANEFVVVQSITSDTSLTISQSTIANSGTLLAFRNTASGQTARKANEAIVIRRAGTYLIAGALAFGASGTGSRRGVIDIGVNGLGGIEMDLATAIGTVSIPTALAFSTIANLAAGSVVMLDAYQDSGGTLTLVADSRTNLVLSKIG